MTDPTMTNEPRMWAEIATVGRQLKDERVVRRSIERQLTALDQRLADLAIEVQSITKLDGARAIKRRLDGIERRLDDRIDNLACSIALVAGNLGNHIASLEHGDRTPAKLQAIERRLDNLSGRDDRCNRRIDNLSAEFREFTEDRATKSSKSSAIGGVAASMDRMTQRVADIMADWPCLDASVDGQQLMDMSRDLVANMLVEMETHMEDKK